MGKRRSKKKNAAGEERTDEKPSSLLNWGPVIIQVFVLGGGMFLLQQIYASLGTHETIKYSPRKVESQQNGQLARITVYKISKKPNRNIKLQFIVDEPENFTILNGSVRKCDLSALKVLFPSARKCEDITNARYVKPERAATEASERTFDFPEFPPDSLYELDFLIESKSGKSIEGKRHFYIIDDSTPVGEDVARQPRELDFSDYLTICRNEFFFIALLVLFGIVVVVHKLRKGSLRRAA